MNVVEDSLSERSSLDSSPSGNATPLSQPKTFYDTFEVDSKGNATPNKDSEAGF